METQNEVIFSIDFKIFMPSNNKSKTELGRIGEQIAYNYLINKGYQIHIQNYRYKRDEIDIIAQFHNLLVFIEVKSRKNNFFGNPEEAVNNTKAANIIRASQNYLQEINWQKDIRFDIIAITGNEIMHFEDAFY